MKIFSADQIRQLEKYMEFRGWVRSQDLMEEAASKAVEWMVQQFDPHTAFLILAGTGHNGGDGLAVCRMLRERGYVAKAYLFLFQEKLSSGAKVQSENLQSAFPEALELIAEGGFIEGIGENTILIDALLGIGLNREPQGWVAETIDRLDRLPHRKISLDIPSGLPADRPRGGGSSVIHADYTLSFHFIKKAFLHEEAARVAGRVIPLSLSFPSEPLESMNTLYSVIERESMSEAYRPRDRFSHKGSLGHGLLIGGSQGMIGAALLMAWAGLRSGLGKLSLRIPRLGYTILQAEAPEAICQIGGEEYIEDFGAPDGYDAIGLGPGMGTDDRTLAAMDKWLNLVRRPLVVDADALNILAMRKDWIHRLPPESLLCPHPKEFDRLFGPSDHSMTRMEKARNQAMKYNIHILVKGHYSQLLSPDGSCAYLYQEKAGLAAAGSGDVLTGLITGLLAQGYAPGIALKLGAYLHGKAGALAADAYGEESMKAGDIPAFFGSAFQSLQTPMRDMPGIEGMD